MDILNKDVLERIIHFAAVSSPRLPNGDGGALACCQLESVCSSLCVLGHQVSWQRIAKSRWNDCNVSLGDARTWRNWYIQRHVFERRVYTALRMAGNDHINTTLHQRDHFKDVIEASIAYNDGNDVNAKPIVHAHGTQFLTSLVRVSPQTLNIHSARDFTISYYANEALRYLRQETIKTRFTEMFLLSSDRDHCEEMALLYQSWILDCEVNVTSLNLQLDVFAEAIEKTFSVEDDDFDRLTKFCAYMHEFGCTGNMQDYYNPNNSFIEMVLKQHRGNPITLALIYIATARRVGLDMSPINFPSHFLVRFVPHATSDSTSVTDTTSTATTTIHTNTTPVDVGDENSTTPNASTQDDVLVRFVDPFDGGAIYTRAEVLHKFSNIIGRASQSQLNHVLGSCSMVDVLQRMCRNSYRSWEPTGYNSRQMFYNAIDLAEFLHPRGIDFRMARVERAVAELSFSEPFFSVCEQDLIHVISNSGRDIQTLRQATVLLGHIKDAQSTLRHNAPVIKSRGTPWTLEPSAPFCGAICRHSLGFTCVVTGWFPTCPNAALQRTNLLKRGLDQPFFSIVTDEGNVHCTALETLEVLSARKVVALFYTTRDTDASMDLTDTESKANKNYNIHHDHYLAPSHPGLTSNNLGRYFGSFSEERGRYFLNSGLLRMYPDDNEC
eukprot:m.242278 g.242278  ORF g.242278 m.242278 type:complete len:666 (+) comp33792_c1_seq9:102-2099(+)